MPYQDSIRAFLWADIRWLLFWALTCGFIGLLFGHFLVGVLIGLLVFIIRQWRALYLLHFWVKFRTNHHPPAITGILSDLSQNFYKIHKNELMLRKQIVNNVQRVRDSISALDASVVLIDGNSMIEWWNPASEKLLNLQAGDQGGSILNLIREPEFIKFYKANDYSESFVSRSWVDPTRFLKFDITPFGDNDKLMIVDDVTRINSLEKMRKDFIANVSHELRTPLTVFSGYIETFMEQDGLNPVWQRGFAQMQQQTIRMNSIVNDLLMLSHLEDDGNQLFEEEVDMPELMVHLFDQAQAYNIEYGHMLDLQIDSQKNLCGARKELLSAFSNLVFNAIKYTPKGGEITISWQEKSGFGEFSVTDNGIGIASIHISRLTERFYRVDSGRSRETGGTGLGLAIVKHVLYRHDAELKIESEQDVGSTFSAVFPANRLK